MITRAKYEIMKIFVPTGIKAIVLVFIFLSIFLGVIPVIDIWAPSATF